MKRRNFIAAAIGGMSAGAASLFGAKAAKATHRPTIRFVPCSRCDDKNVIVTVNGEQYQKIMLSWSYVADDKTTIETIKFEYRPVNSPAATSDPAPDSGS